MKHTKSPSKLPPGPFPWPIIGNILKLGNKPHASLAHLAKNFGPLISLRLGTQLVVVGSSTHAATEILKTHDQIFSGRWVPHAVPASPDRLHLSIAWADCTDQWKFLRMLCRTDLFSSKAIESQAKIRDNKVTELVKLLASKEGKAVMIRDIVFTSVSNTFSNLLVSKDLIISVQEGNELRKLVREFVELHALPNLADYYSILSGFDLQGINKKSREILTKLSGLWVDIIKERRDEDEDSGVLRQPDFLDCLIDRRLTDEQINYLMMELFLAAGDTTTSTVEWAMTEMVKNPEVMKKVRIELERKINNENVIKESDLPPLSYLHAVVNETLRLHPPGPLLSPHRAVETCKVMNYIIPKDCQVLVNVWAIGRDPEAWDEPMEFKPERFLEADMEHSFKFIPFGAGRRICPGQPMATKQVPLILASLIKCFDWSLPDGTYVSDVDMEENFGISLEKARPLVLIPKLKKPYSMI